MAGVLTNVGEDRMLGLLVNKGAGYVVGSVTLRLFKNDFAPGEGDGTSTGYTEAAFGGYAGVALTGASWTISTTGSPTLATYAQQTFTCTAATSESIYGYYLATSSGGVPIVERFPDAPYVVTNNGDTIRITPSVGLD